MWLRGNLEWGLKEWACGGHAWEGCGLGEGVTGRSWFVKDHQVGACVPLAGAPHHGIHRGGGGCGTLEIVMQPACRQGVAWL